MLEFSHLFSIGIVKTDLLLFVNLFVVVLCSKASDHLLFNMNFASIFLGLLCGNAECYADAALPKLS